MTTTSPDDYTVLHSQRLADDGAPALLERFVGYLDEHDGELVTAAACARLEADRPDLYRALYLVRGQKLSLRKAGRHLGLTHRTVGKHVDAALTIVRAYCEQSA